VEESEKNIAIGTEKGKPETQRGRAMSISFLSEESKGRSQIVPENRGDNIESAVKKILAPYWSIGGNPKRRRFWGKKRKKRRTTYNRNNKVKQDNEHKARDVKQES